MHFVGKIKVLACIQTVLLSLGAGILVLLVYTSAAPAETTSRYKPEECVRCHAGQVRDLAIAGGNHKNVRCSDCHAGHPPEVKKPIAPCSRCHGSARNIHFETPRCLSCHTNPHTPLKMSFKGAGTDTCLVCHGLQGWQLRNYQSKHSALTCATCHDVHRKFPSCTKCHVPHSGKIAGGCNFCHKAHMPKPAPFADTAPSEDCGMCHKIVANLFKAATTKHKTLSCRGCHQQGHRVIPACEDCHGTPHPKNMMVKFPHCGECHNIAHDINWTVEDNAATPEKTAKQRQ